MSATKKVIAVVIPCYNEELAIGETASLVKDVLSELISSKVINSKSKVVFVDDGSNDGTWKKVVRLHNKDKMFRGVKLSRNRGHQGALLAGLMYAKEWADVSISMDADLQDDVGVIRKMIEKHESGAEIVYGVRSDRRTDSFFKRNSAKVFYGVMGMLGVESVKNSADCRLMSRRALDELGKFREVNLFLRGIVPLIGLRTASVEYERGKRCAGESKYPLRKMMGFAIDGITSFSVKPLRLIAAIGMVIAMISVAIAVYAVLRWLAGETVEGWTFTAISIWFIGGVQVFSIGVLGEYIGKIYIEVKDRPRYIIEDVLE